MFTIAANVLGLCVRAGFQSTKLQVIPKIQLKHKAPSLHVSPPDAKPLLVAGLFLVRSKSFK